MNTINLSTIPEGDTKILQFINTRFPEDCKWNDGNCYYFSVILRNRFPRGKIFYDTRMGHFVFKYNDLYYDWHGVYLCDDEYLIPWSIFKMYDKSQYNRIIRDCIL